MGPHPGPQGVGVGGVRPARGGGRGGAARGGGREGAARGGGRGAVKGGDRGVDMGSEGRGRVSPTLVYRHVHPLWDLDLFLLPRPDPRGTRWARERRVSTPYPRPESSLESRLSRSPTSRGVSTGRPVHTGRVGSGPVGQCFCGLLVSESDTDRDPTPVRPTRPWKDLSTLSHPHPHPPSSDVGVLRPGGQRR